MNFLCSEFYGIFAFTILADCSLTPCPLCLRLSPLACQAVDYDGLSPAPLPTTCMCWVFFKQAGEEDGIAGTGMDAGDGGGGAGTFAEGGVVAGIRIFGFGLSRSTGNSGSTQIGA